LGYIFERDLGLMTHDPELLEQLSAFETDRFDGEAFRATGLSVDPLAPSTNGGRWAPRGEISVLYTSLERNGAIAEVASYLALLRPRPRKRLAVHRLRVTASRTLRLIRADLARLDVDMERYGTRNYQRTQEIAALCSKLTKRRLPLTR
jgi:hypothetical protein